MKIYWLQHCKSFLFQSTLAWKLVGESWVKNNAEMSKELESVDIVCVGTLKCIYFSNVQ